MLLIFSERFWPRGNIHMAASETARAEGDRWAAANHSEFGLGVYCT
jgi:hypothetical protein